MARTRYSRAYRAARPIAVANRRHSAQRIKHRWTYNVREAAKATGATPGTIRNWQKNGLEAVVDVHPAIFRGVDIIAFLRSRSRARKQPCGPGRFFCFRCKTPKRPAYNEVEFWPDGPKLGWLRGLCPDCAAVMNRRVSRAKLKAAAGDLTVSMQRADSRLSEMPMPNCNDNSEEVTARVKILSGK